MNYIELSIEDVRKKSKILFDIIKKYYDYDLVIFIAKGSFIIGEELARLNNTPLIEITAKRKGGYLKSIIKHSFKFVPKKILINLRKKEMKSSVHEKKSERYVNFDEEKYHNYLSAKKILLVDDSIDSGNTIISIYNKIKEVYPKSVIKIAVFNEMKKSKRKADYKLYTDHMICGPWSSDSKEHKKFLQLYNGWRENHNE